MKLKKNGPKRREKMEMQQQPKVTKRDANLKMEKMRKMQNLSL